MLRTRFSPNRGSAVILRWTRTVRGIAKKYVNIPKTKITRFFARNGNRAPFFCQKWKSRAVFLPEMEIARRLFIKNCNSFA
jgi:hypothetical protein